MGQHRVARPPEVPLRAEVPQQGRLASGPLDDVVISSRAEGIALVAADVADRQPHPRPVHQEVVVIQPPRQRVVADPRHGVVPGRLRHREEVGAVNPGPPGPDRDHGDDHRRHRPRRRLPPRPGPDHQRHRHHGQQPQQRAEGEGPLLYAPGRLAPSSREDRRPHGAAHDRQGQQPAADPDEAAADAGLSPDQGRQPHRRPDRKPRRAQGGVAVGPPEQPKGRQHRRQPAQQEAVAAQGDQGPKDEQQRRPRRRPRPPPQRRPGEQQRQHAIVKAPVVQIGQQQPQQLVRREIGAQHKVGVSGRADRLGEDLLHGQQGRRPQQRRHHRAQAQGQGQPPEI